MENNNGNKIRNILFNEVSLITGVVAVAIVSVLFISGPDAQLQQDVALIKQDIETIKTNELVHIQASIDNNTARANGNSAMIIEINLKLERIITLLEK